MLLITGGMFSCNGKKTESTVSADEGLIEITPEQFKSSNMRLGAMELQTFHDRVMCKGYVSVPANAMSRVCPSIAGKIVDIRYKLGDFVPAGRVIATISGNDFMALQNRLLPIQKQSWTMSVPKASGLKRLEQKRTFWLHRLITGVHTQAINPCVHVSTP